MICGGQNSGESLEHWFTYLFPFSSQLPNDNKRGSSLLFLLFMQLVTAGWATAWKGSLLFQSPAWPLCLFLLSSHATEVFWSKEHLWDQLWSIVTLGRVTFPITKYTVSCVAQAHWGTLGPTYVLEPLQRATKPTTNHLHMCAVVKMNYWIRKLMKNVFKFMGVRYWIHAPYHIC